MRTQPSAGILKPEEVLAITASASEIAMPGGHANCIYLGVTGSPVLTIKGTSVTFNNLSAGIWHPMPNFTHMTSAGSATGVIAGRTA